MAGGTFVTFGLGAEQLALPVAAVVEILDAVRPAALPRAPAHLWGLIDRRGASVPLVDLRTLLGLPGRPDDAETRVIVLRLPGEAERGRTAGLRVDRVIEVTELDGPGAEPLAEAGLLRWDERLVAGVGRRAGRFVTALRVEGLFEEGLVPPAPAPGAGDAP